MRPRTFIPTRGSGPPPSEHMKIMERLTQIDEETILYDFMIEDPTIYTEYRAGEIPFRKCADLSLRVRLSRGQLFFLRYAQRRTLSGELRSSRTA